MDDGFDRQKCTNEVLMFEYNLIQHVDVGQLDDILPETQVDLHFLFVLDQ